MTSNKYILFAVIFSSSTGKGIPKVLSTTTQPPDSASVSTLRFVSKTLYSVIPAMETAKSAKEIIASLRKEPFSLETDEKLANHPVVQEARAGTLSLKVVERFLCEQYHIIAADTRTMEHLVARFEANEVLREYFQFFLAGEKMGYGKLLNMAKAMKLSESDLENYEPQANAQGYPSYLCRLAHYGEAPQIAAAIAVNFPAFGQMCSSLADSLKKNYNMKEEDVDFVRFFAAGDLDEGAVKAIEAYNTNEKGKLNEVHYKDIKRAVRLLQAYEVMFWDSIYSSAWRRIYAEHWSTGY